MTNSMPSAPTNYSMPTKSLIPAPQSSAFLAGAGSPRDAAMAAGMQKANLLNNLNNAVARGGRKKRYRGGATNQIPISIPVPMYANANGGQGVTNQTMQNAGNVGQLAVNNDFFKNVQAPTPIPANQLKLKGGCGCDWKGGSKRKRTGYKRKRKAGTRIMGPNTTWGCHSGGKSRKTKRQSTKRKSTKRRYG
uniref:Uncharacterized protein n=1 Tax=viral metagenome TaxID=1070528 RepID=A0A6C0LFP8_9ZZZZ